MEIYGKRFFVAETLFATIVMDFSEFVSTGWTGIIGIILDAE